MAWFRILYSSNAFERSLDGARARDLSPASGVRAMVAFYRDHRAQHADVPAGDDVLEFRWGPVGDEFETAVVRRIRRHGSIDPERTLELAWRFARTERRDAVTSGQFAIDDPVESAAFLRRVTSSAPWVATKGAAVRSSTLSEG